MLRAILNKSWRQHPTRHQLYGHLPPIMKTIQVRRTRHAGHCWRSKDELISYVLLWTPAYGQAKAGRPARTYIKQLCEDTGCSPEDLPEAMNDREKWRERVSDIRASGTTWWWWWNTYSLMTNSSFFSDSFSMMILNKLSLSRGKTLTTIPESSGLTIAPRGHTPSSTYFIFLYNVYFTIFVVNLKISPNSYKWQSLL